MRFLLVCLLVLVGSSPAFSREAKEQRTRRDAAARQLLLALDDRDGNGVQAAAKIVAQNLEPAGVPVFAPLRARLEALAADLIRSRDSVSYERLRAAIADTTDTFGVDTAPPLTPDLTMARSVYKAQCSACHGAVGAGDGSLAAKVPGGVPSFLKGAAASKSPFAFYQKIAAGKAGTPMRGYETKLEAMTLWSLAFLAASFDSERPVKELDLSPLLKRGLTLERLARSDDEEIVSWAGDRALLPALRTQAPFAPAVPRLVQGG